MIIWDSIMSIRYRFLVQGGAAALLSLMCPEIGSAQANTLIAQAQIGSMRQESIKAPSVPDNPRTIQPATDVPSSGVVAQLPTLVPPIDGMVGSGYDPSGRRDPFAPVIIDLQPGRIDENLPPLQRVSLTELNLIAIVWGAYGYTAMVQTPEGHGYTVRRGTRVGQNSGVVSAVTERGLIVQERFTDVYGKKQEREYVKLLHPKEGSE
jgi:type IV pilus assembly protein PilP